MKKNLLRYLLLLFSFGLFSTKLSAQVPTSPGTDPLKFDSTTAIIGSLQDTNPQSNSDSNFLPERKNFISFNKNSDSLFLRKKGENETHSPF